MKLKISVFVSEIKLPHKLHDIIMIIFRLLSKNNFSFNIVTLLQSTVPPKRSKGNPQVFFDISLDNKDVGRISMELRADVVPVTTGRLFSSSGQITVNNLIKLGCEESFGGLFSKLFPTALSSIQNGHCY